VHLQQFYTYDYRGRGVREKVEIMMFYTSVYSGRVRTIFASFIKIEDNTRGLGSESDGRSE
jgi:hypothetical protein